MAECLGRHQQSTRTFGRRSGRGGGRSRAARRRRSPTSPGRRLPRRPVFGALTSRIFRRWKVLRAALPLRCSRAAPLGQQDRIAFAQDVAGVAVRCPFDYPAVIETEPVLSGAPNPTLLYLTCPTMARAVSGVEAAGAVREFRRWIRTDKEACQTLEELTRWYKRRRASLARGQPTGILAGGGIGGPAGPDKASCLHAYAAAMLAADSGWLHDERVEGSGDSASLQRIWARFFPPAKEMWCGEGVCGRFETGEVPTNGAKSR